MSTFGEHAAQGPDRTDKTGAMIASSGSIALAIGGGIAAVLAIIGLAGAWSTWMVTLATLFVGAALIAEGLAIAARNARILSRTKGTVESSELAGGVSAEFLAGCVGIVLGIIALVGVNPVVLSAAAVVVFGSAMIFGSSIRSRAEDIDVIRTETARPHTEPGPGPDVAHPSPGPLETRPVEQRQSEQRHEQQSGLLSPVSGTHLMVGLGTVALGIVALAQVRPIVLTLVALLVLGFTFLLSGAAVGSRLMMRSRHAAR